MGATVIIVGRDEETGTLVQRELQEANGNSSVDFLLTDLSSQKSVRNLANTVKAKYPQLHVLINNAGTFFTKRRVT